MNQPSKKLSYKPLKISETARTKVKLTNEQRFWKKFRTQLCATYQSPAYCISSNNNETNNFAIGHGFTVSLYNPSLKQFTKDFNIFTNNVSAVCIRKDGAVMACANQIGHIQLVDTKDRFRLRSFRNHKKKVNALQFQGNDLYSAGDDLTIRFYDVATGTVIHSYDDAHSDYIKSLKCLQQSHILSASYDKTIKLYDFRVHEDPQITFNFTEPVQCIDTFNSKISFAACGGKKIAIWDIRYQKPILEAVTNKKLTSSIKIANNSSRIITSSYDNHLKIFKTDSLQLTYQQKFPSSILSLDITSNQAFMCLGLDNSQLHLKSKAKKVQADSDESDKQIQDEIAQWFKNNEQKMKKTALNDQYFYRGIYEKPTSYDIKFERNQNKKVNQYDEYLKKFQYKQAILTSLYKTNYLIFQALIDQLIQRGVLQRTLKSFTTQQLNSILGYLIKLISNPKYSKTVLYVVQLLIDLHSQNKEVNWNPIKQQLQTQMKINEELWQLDGMLDILQANM